MTQKLADRFMNALQEAERTGNIDALVDLFADDAELSNLAATEPHKGREGASRFWREYLSAFNEVQSNFTKVVAGDSSVALEWESTGSLPTGEPLKYGGVSMLDVHDGKVSRFRAYYDSAAFLPQGAKRRAGEPQG